MGGGLMQLVAYGAQDIYLTGNPQITFFKVVYRRHTNFSMESIAQTFSGTQSAGSKVTSTVSRNGDLVHKMYYTFNPSTLGITTACANLGNTLLSEVELEIGGQRIDRHYGHWLTVWQQLTEVNPTGLQSAIGALGQDPGVGTATLGQLMSYNHQGAGNAVGTAPTFASVPLQFWFCRNPGLALPLIALQYHEVKVSITFCTSAQAGAGTLSLTSGQLWVDYIYLDTDERRRFAQQSHEYLIEQLQYQQTAANSSVDINFNHPVKELVFTGLPDATVAATTSAGTPTSLGRLAAADTMCLKLNGHERFTPRHPQYFTRTQVHQHHTGFGGVTQRDSIGVYSFALKPEEHQPSGTCNFSRIDNARLEQAGANAEGLNVYAVNYNVLRVMSGMGGLAYSN
jgi:hypothetical protein